MSTYLTSTRKSLLQWLIVTAVWQEQQQVLRTRFIISWIKPSWREINNYNLLLLEVTLLRKMNTHTHRALKSKISKITC